MNDNYGEVSTLIKMNSELEEINNKADSARIHNPSLEVKNALKDFATARLRRVEEDASFTDEVKEVLKQRLPEATFSELMQLLKISSEANNAMTESLVNMFQPQSSDKTVLERLSDNSTETTAAKLFANTDDKATIQAVAYLGSVLDKLSSKNNLKDIEGEVKDPE